MAKRVIAYSGIDFTGEQKEALRTTARELNVELREIPPESADSSLVADCDALAGEFADPMIESAKNLRWFHSSWAGVDALIGLAPFRERRAVLTNSAGAYNTMIAEHLVAGCLSLLRNFPAYLDAQRKHVWRDVVPADSFAGKRVTVLGFGNSGGAFAKLASAMGAVVSGLNTRPKEKPAWLENLYSRDQLDTALANADILALCLPYTKDTDKIVSARELALLPKGALVLNTGRGKTLDADALAAALASGGVAGAMLDVFPEEPLPADSPLWDIPNLIITPHVSGHASDATNMRYIFDLFVENMRRWAKGEPLANVVDLDRGY